MNNHLYSYLYSHLKNNFLNVNINMSNIFTLKSSMFANLLMEKPGN